jgi:TolB-like protein
MGETSMSFPSSSQSPATDGPTHKDVASRLNSWKEIASYFARDIRTVQLWEKQEALPVHRHEHSARSSVYAYPAELNTWLRNRSQEKITAPLDPAASKPVIPSLRNPRVGALIATVLLMALVAWAWGLNHRRKEAAPWSGPEQTLAVLPFEDLSEDGSGNLWVDGLTDDLITNLGKAGHLQVISRRSVMQFKAKHAPLPTIARQLHATLILEGTVMHGNGRARVTAQLLDAANDRQIWAESYTRKTDDILSLQDDIAGDIATGVTAKLTGTVSQASSDSHPVDPQVRLAYLTGHYFLSQRDEPGLLKAIDFFKQAIAKDPHYAPAYSGLADSYNLLAVWGSLPSAEAFPQARAAAQTALQLDPSSAEAYNSLAFETYRYEWNFSQAETFFRKAIQLNPNYATAHQWYGEFLGDLRRFDESIAELRKAKELDPLSAIIGSDLATGYIHAGRDAEAIVELQRILALYPNFVPAHNYLASCYDDLGDWANAEKESLIYSRLTGNGSQFRVIRIVHDARTGKMTRARAELNDFLRDKNLISFQKAQMYFTVGENDKGYAALEQAFSEHSWWLVTLMVDPGFKTVPADPRLQQLMKRVGLPVVM